MTDLIRPVALSIAGSDSGGGAGIQADLKAFHSLGIHGCSAITAMTAQNLRGVTQIQVSTVEFLRAQIDAVLSEFDVRAIKIGMLANASIAMEVATVLQANPRIPVVLDPVMVATSGSTLLEPSAIEVMRDALVPLAHVLTPNIPEAELLLGRKISSAADMDAACRNLLAMGTRSVLLKGAHLDSKNVVMDVFFDGVTTRAFTHARLPFEAHGTGCTLSSAIAARIVKGDELSAACANGIAFVQSSLASAYRLSDSSVRILNMSKRID